MEMLLLQQILLINFALFGCVHPTVIPTNLECDFNKEICNPAYCQLLKGRGKFKYMSASCNFVKPLKAAMAEMEIFRRNKMDEYKSMNMKTLVDVCKMENTNGGNGVINYIVSMSMSSMSSIKCPLRGNITITRMPLMVFIVEGFFGEGEYKMSSKVYSGALTVLNLSLSITSGRN